MCGILGRTRPSSHFTFGGVTTGYTATGREKSKRRRDHRGARERPCSTAAARTTHGYALIYPETPTYHHHTNTSSTAACPQKWQTQRVSLTTGWTYWRDIIGYVSWTGSNKRINVSSATRRGVGSRARPATGYFGRSLVLEHLCNRSRANAHDSPRTLFERSETRTMIKPPPLVSVAHRLRFGA